MNDIHYLCQKIMTMINVITPMGTYPLVKPHLLNEGAIIVDLCDGSTPPCEVDAVKFERYLQRLPDWMQIQKKLKKKARKNDLAQMPLALNF